MYGGVEWGALLTSKGVYAHTCIYIEKMLTPPPFLRHDTRKCTSWCPDIHRATEPQIQKSQKPKKPKPKTKTSKNPEIQKSKTPNFFARFRSCEKFLIFGFLVFWTFGFLGFWIFGILDFWNFGFWMFVFWILRLVHIWTPRTAFPCTVGARVG